MPSLLLLMSGHFCGWKRNETAFEEETEELLPICYDSFEHENADLFCFVFCFLALCCRF